MNDGDKVAKYMTEAASQANKIGRTIVYGIIAVGWSFSLKDGSFLPSILIQWSLVLSLIYIVLDLFYRVFSALFYRVVLKKFFYSIKNQGFEYKVDKNDGCTQVNKLTRKWNAVGVYFLLSITGLLIVSGVLLILSLLIDK